MVLDRQRISGARDSRGGRERPRDARPDAGKRHHGGRDKRSSPEQVTSGGTQRKQPRRKRDEKRKYRAEQETRRNHAQRGIDNRR
jgi:hypothetical protein